MPSKDPTQRFEDILENVILIEEFTRGMNLKDFLEDLRTATGQSDVSKGSAKRRESWESWLRTYVRVFGGPRCGRWGTSYGTNTTELMRLVCGW